MFSALFRLSFARTKKGRKIPPVRLRRSAEIVKDKRQCRQQKRGNGKEIKYADGPEGFSVLFLICFFGLGIWRRNRPPLGQPKIIPYKIFPKQKQFEGITGYISLFRIGQSGRKQNCPAYAKQTKPGYEQPKHDSHLTISPFLIAKTSAKRFIWKSFRVR